MPDAAGVWWQGSSGSTAGLTWFSFPAWSSPFDSRRVRRAGVVWQHSLSNTGGRVESLLNGEFLKVSCSMEVGAVKGKMGKMVSAHFFDVLETKN
jgi:hypothetical protein